MSGRVCKIDGIIGHQISSTDQILVLDTCGVAEAVTPWRFPHEHSNMIRPSFSLHAEGGSSISWGSVEMIAEGGQYRLCWCGRKPSPDFQHRTNSSSGVPVVDRLGPSPVDNGNVSNETPPGMGTPWTLPHLCHTLEDFRVEYLVATVAPSRWVGQAPPRPWWPDQTRFLTARA